MLEDSERLAIKIGYARVSTEDQRLTLQLKALKQAGCNKVFREKLSGVYRDRPELNQMLDQLREGDVVTVWKLDRLARSTRNLLDMVETIRQAAVLDIYKGENNSRKEAWISGRDGTLINLPIGSKEVVVETLKRWSVGIATVPVKESMRFEVVYDLDRCRGSIALVVSEFAPHFGFASTRLATTSHRRSVEESIERDDATLRDEDHIFTCDRWALAGCSKPHR